MRYALIFGAEALLFLLLTVNYRACAKGWAKTTVGTDAVIAAVNFSLIKWIAETGTYTEQAFYIAGAIVGSALGMSVTRQWKES